MKKLLIPALIFPMTVQAFDVGSLFGLDMGAINKCNSELVDRTEIDTENEIMTYYYNNGSTLTLNAKTGETVFDGPKPTISAECQKHYAELENSPFVEGAMTEPAKEEVVVVEDEEMTSEEKLDLVDKATKVTDSVFKRVSTWFD